MAVASARVLPAGYSAVEVAQILGVSESRVRAFVRAGLITPARGPRGEHRFTVQDLVVLRTARSLAVHMGPARVQRALQQVKEQVPDRPLAGLQISLLGDELLVRDGRALWRPASGQQVLDFDAATASPKVARLTPRGERPSLTANQWYERGCDLDGDDPAAARAAYEQALVLDPGHAAARINLGRLLQENGYVEAAIDQYRLVLAADASHALAAFNLGVALEDLGRGEEARAAYEQALAADASLADAHYNLSRVHERAGRLADAIRHLKAYRELAGPRR